MQTDESTTTQNKERLLSKKNLELFNVLNGTNLFDKHPFLPDCIICIMPVQLSAHACYKIAEGPYQLKSNTGLRK